MIDDAAILFCTIMCVVVLFRAIKLDGQRPWFGSAATDRAAGQDGEPDAP